MKSFRYFVSGACLWLCFAHATQAQDAPFPGTQLSPDGPTSAVMARAKPFSQAELSALAGKPTYTYLRCHYRSDSDPAGTRTTYRWATATDGKWYRVEGYWRADGILQWQNMFYASTKQTTLHDICRQTLDREGIHADVAMFSGADNPLSLNYTIWTNGPAIDPGKTDRIVAFGDSLTDTGNIYNATLWRLPAGGSWFLGRFSNGPVWAEYLSKATGLPLYNWAVGSAAADDVVVIPGLLARIESWKTYMAEAKDYDPRNTLFLLLIGGNDIVNYGRSVESIIAAQRSAIERIIDTGATKILVSNLPDVSRAPTFRMRTDGAKIAAEVAKYNMTLRQMINELSVRKGVNILLYDAHALIEGIIANPQQHGFDNVTDSCLKIDTDSVANYLLTHARRGHCTPDSFVFWDTLHPTTRTHRAMAEDVRKFIPESWLQRP
jgi:thermolabile hemolysin